MTELLSQPTNVPVTVDKPADSAGVGTSPIDTSKVPFAITDRSFIPPQRYYDREFFELEKTKLWPYTWQMACRLDEIPNTGDYAEYSLLDYSVLVVRTSPTEIKAYQNACRHRGTQLAQGTGTFRGGQIVCPFHAWRWNIDGTPSLPLYGSEAFEERLLDPEDLKLVECLVDSWAGFVFINMDLNARPLREFLAPVPEYLDPLEIDRMRVEWWRGIRLKCNWKAAQEAFMEGWHVRGTHTQLTGGAGDDFPNPHDLQRSYDNGHASLAKDPDDSKVKSKVKGALGLGGVANPDHTISYLKMIVDQLASNVLEKDVHVAESLRTCPPEEFSKRFIDAWYEWNAGAGIKVPPRGEATTGRWSSQWSTFPNFKLHPSFGNSLAYRIRPDDPNDPEHCYFEVWSLSFHPESEPPSKPKFTGEFTAESGEWPLIFAQDFINVQKQRKGFHQPGFKAQRMGRKYEDGICNNHVELDKYLAR